MGKKTQLRGIQSHPCACFCYAAFTAHAQVLLWEGKEESRHLVCVKSKAQVPGSVLVKGNNVFKRKLSHKAFKVVCVPAFVAQHLVCAQVLLFCYWRVRIRAAILLLLYDPRAWLHAGAEQVLLLRVCGPPPGQAQHVPYRTQGLHPEFKHMYT